MRALMWAGVFFLLSCLAALAATLAWPLMWVMKVLKYAGNKAEFEYLLADLEQKTKNKGRP